MGNPIYIKCCTSVHYYNVMHVAMNYFCKQVRHHHNGYVLFTFLSKLALLCKMFLEPFLLLHEHVKGK